MSGRARRNGLWAAACALAVTAPLLYGLPAALYAFSPPPIPAFPASAGYQDHFSVGTRLSPALLLPLLGVLAFVASPVFAVSAWRREGPGRRRTWRTVLYLLLNVPALALLLNVLAAP